MSKQKRLMRIILYVLILSLPYLLAWITQGDKVRFSGLLLNPIDGYSYFAKMKEGYNGQWLFTLPFTAQPGRGSFLFVFYLFLGHLSRITRISIPVMFHLIRLAGAVAFLDQLTRFIDRYIHLNHFKPEQIFNFIFLASGLGWIALLFQYKSADLWVAEAYPFYSALISPHFIIGMALFLLIINQLFQAKHFWNTFLLMLAGIALAVIMPFGAVILIGLSLILWLFVPEWRSKGNLFSIVIISLPAGLLLIGQYLQTVTNPVLEIWNQQNITVNPPYWDLCLSFSPMILLAIIALGTWKVHWPDKGYRLNMVWFLMCIILVVLPISLQRRFLFSFAIPVTVMGLYGLDILIEKYTLGTFLQKAVFILPLITIVILYILMGFSVLQKSTYAYLTVDELAAYQWINDRPDDQVIFSDEVHALRIPFYTGKRVFYAHPYETVNAVKKEAQTQALLHCTAMDEVNAAIFMRDQKIDLALLMTENYVQAECFHGYPILNRNREFILLDVGE